MYNLIFSYEDAALQVAMSVLSIPGQEDILHSPSFPNLPQAYSIYDTFRHYSIF